jgi:catechol 2,3-dioxygenase-like lactoylglutathione lyase family enzyme
MPPTYGHGKICYVELPAADVAQSAAFYTAAFGWKMRRRGDGATAFDDGVGEVSGAFVTDRPPVSDIGILIYIMVDSVADAVKQVVAAAPPRRTWASMRPKSPPGFATPPGTSWGCTRTRRTTAPSSHAAPAPAPAPALASSKQLRCVQSRHLRVLCRITSRNSSHR